MHSVGVMLPRVLLVTAIGAILSALVPRVARADWVSELKAPEPEIGPEAKPDPPKREAPDVPEWNRVHFDDRPFNLQVRLGPGTSVGALGIVAEYDVADWLNFGAGFGVNLAGGIAGLHSRLRPFVFRTGGGRAAHAIVLEGAVSYGQYAEFDILPLCEGNRDDPASSCYSRRIMPEWVWWTQVEAGWEYRARSGFLVRVTQGAAFLVTTPDWKCTHFGAPVPCKHVPQSGIPTVTMALGYAF
jgi:hypothetical protein